MDIKCRVEKTNTYTIEWRILNYFEVSENAYQSEVDGERVLVTEQKHADGPLPFQAQIEFLDHEDDDLEISYMSQNSLLLESVRCVRIINQAIAEDSEKAIGVSEPQWVEKNEWYSLAVIDNFEKIGKSNRLKLRFDFVVKQASNSEMLETKSNMVSDIGAHLMNKTFSDIILKTSDGNELPAHKIIVVARSDVFRAHFEHDTVEKATNIVECPFETDVVEDLLSYIYTAEASNIDKTASRLLVAADYYHLDVLKDMCGDVLKKKLNIDNAVEVLSLANTHGAAKLKRSTMEYIIDEKQAAKIIQTDGWKSMQSAELVKSIYEFSFLDN